MIDAAGGAHVVYFGQQQSRSLQHDYKAAGATTWMVSLIESKLGETYVSAA